MGGSGLGRVLAAWAAAAGVVCAGARAEPDPRRVFDVVGGRVESVVVTRSASPPAESALGSPMLWTLGGVIGEVSARDAGRLRSMVRAGRAPETLAGARLVGVMHLLGSRGGKRVEILRVEGVGLVASEIDPIDASGEPAAAVLPEAFEEIVSGWSLYGGGFELPETPRGEVVDMAHPYVASSVTFDERVISERFAGGGRHGVRGAVRDLEAETLWVRLPRGYDPRRPAGLLVWLDPSDSGRPPGFTHSAADEGNFIVVGSSNAGNDRVVSDRHQLAFDAMATAMSRYHVDESRVYAVGVSGGGRLATMHWACFPDVFAGGVAIVGVAPFEDVAVEGGVVRRQFVLPRTSRGPLRRNRLGIVSGDGDYNLPEILETMRFMEIERLAARLFRYEDMGHEYPTAARFGEALAWVDGLWREERAEAEARAVRMLEGVEARLGADGGEPTPGEREALVRITREAAWSDAAWEAAGLLGLGAGG